MNLIAAEPVTRHRLSADQFQRMGEAGVFAPEERVELIEGEIINMAPIGVGHFARTNALTAAFAPFAGTAAVLSVQGPLRLNPKTELYPDFCLLRLPATRYDKKLPDPQDVLLLVEVAQSSLRYDRNVKLPLYAHAGIVEVWLLDVDRARVVRHAEPADGAYLRSEVLRGRVAPLALAECVIDIEGLFPPA